MENFTIFSCIFHDFFVVFFFDGFRRKFDIAGDLRAALASFGAARVAHFARSDFISPFYFSLFSFLFIIIYLFLFLLARASRAHAARVIARVSGARLVRPGQKSTCMIDFLTCLGNFLARNSRNFLPGKFPGIFQGNFLGNSFQDSFLSSWEIFLENFSGAQKRALAGVQGHSGHFGQVFGQVPDQASRSKRLEWRQFWPGFGQNLVKIRPARTPAWAGV